MILIPFDELLFFSRAKRTANTIVVTIKSPRRRPRIMNGVFERDSNVGVLYKKRNSSFIHIS
jgi:hypothetical protein